MVLVVENLAVRMSDREESQNENLERKGRSRIIGRVLPGAVRLWLRSQLENVEQLDIRLDGSDREIVSGRLLGVTVGADSVVYRGIHIGSVDLSAKDIRINIGQVVRGKPLRLLKAFPVLGEVLLSPQDLNNSMGSALLLDGVTDFWRGLARSPQLAEEIQSRYGSLPLDPDVVLHDVLVALGEACLGLSFYPSSQSERAAEPIVLSANLSIVSGHILRISSARWLSRLSDMSDLDKGTVVEALEGFEWDLGKDAQISQLILHPDRLLCAGQIQVRP